jgi:hypothetical protein
VLHYLTALLFDSRHFLWWGQCKFFARTWGIGSEALIKCRFVEEEQNRRGLAESVGILFPGGISSVPTTSVSDPVATGSMLKISGFFASSIQRSPSSAWKTVGVGSLGAGFESTAGAWVFVALCGAAGVTSEQITEQQREWETIQDEHPSAYRLHLA